MYSVFKRQMWQGLGSFALLSVAVADTASAIELTAPFFFETAQVLPSGVRNPRFYNLYMSIDSKFNGKGQVESLGNPLNKAVTWSDVVSMEKNPSKKAGIRALLSKASLDPEGSPGNTTGQVNTFFDVKVPVLAAGITDRLTLGVAVPIMNISVSADTGFSRSEDGQAFMNTLCTTSVTECNSAAARMNNAVNERAKAYGYQPITSKQISNIGDIQLMSKYVLHRNAENLLTLKSTLTLPTGLAPDVDAALDVPTGDGRFQVGSSLIYDRNLTRDLRWNSFGGVNVLMPKEMERRVPMSADNPLSPDKERLTRQLGAVVGMGTSLQYAFSSLGIVTSAGYNFQYLTPTRWSGGALEPERYGYLESLTPEETLHSAMVMAGFSTVEWYQQKKFFYPFQANFLISHPLVGRNVTTNDVIAGELVFFF